MLKAHVFFSGIVQGVGFRYTVMEKAKQYRVNGWVKNLDDGRVEAVFEGDRDKIHDLITAVEQHFIGNIADKEESIESSDGEYLDFEIRY